MIPAFLAQTYFRLKHIFNSNTIKTMKTNLSGMLCLTHSKNFGGKFVALFVTLFMLMVSANATADAGYIVKLNDYGKTLILTSGEESMADGETCWTLDYWISNYGAYVEFQAGYNTNVVYIDKSFASAKPTSIPFFFYHMANLEAIEGLENLNTANVTDMKGLFGCSDALTFVDLSSFNTEKVTDMGGMFIGCKKLTLEGINNFNTANVTDMSSMFCGCKALTSLDLSNFNTGKVKAMDYMFNGCSTLTNVDVSSFNTENVTEMEWMFGGCSALTSLNLSNFNIKSVTNMRCMFYGCISLQELNIGNMDINKVDKKENCFYGVGTPEEPCKLIVGTEFDQTVLGSSRINAAGATYYRWLGGCFTAPVIDGGITGISQSTVIQSNADNITYGINGQRVSEGYKGVVVINGKKVIR